jgi:Rne/Rng family ribonuclease
VSSLATRLLLHNTLPGEFMAKELIISANVHEKKVAIVEDGLVTEFYVERRDENQGVVGNLYKGRVMKVLPGMQSAFVDIGLERDAFLYVSDFAEFMEEEDEIDFREPAEDQRSQPPRREDRFRRGERRREELPPQPVAAVEEALPENPVRLEDAVEQLAEIAVERVIPPPPSEEDLSAEKEPEVDAEASVSEFTAERVTDDLVEPPAEEIVVAEASDEEPVKGRRSRSRKKPSEETDKAKSKTRSAKGETVKTAGKRGSQRTGARRGAKEPEVDSEIEVVAPDADSYQRVTDEDIEQDAGELLKDAMLQERLIEQVHDAEYRTAPVQAEPEPEWRVGSLRSKVQTDSDFHRIVDESGESRDSVLESVSEIDAGSGSPFRHLSDAIPSMIYEHFNSAPSRDSQDEDAASTAPYEAVSGWEPAGFSRVQESDEAENSEPDEDREAGIRDRGGRSEFAVRRGGRGRRGRRSGKKPPPATDEAAAQPEGDSEAGDEAAQPAEAASEASDQVTDQPTASLEPSEPAPQGAPGRTPRPQEQRPPDQKQDQRGDRGRGRFDRRPDHRRTEHAPSRRPDRGAPPTISDLLHEGQEILVQIAKEPIAKKGARITSHIALPGRLLVYMPTVNHIGVSRKIPNEGERIRLKRIVTTLRDRESAGGGFIARTACAGHSEQELHDDMRYLLRTWGDVRKKAERVKAPALAHRDLDLVQRILRDQLSEDFSAIRIDNEVEYARIVEFVNRVQPKLVKRVKLYVGDQPIFEKHAVQPEIDKAVRPRVWLKSGGYIVINQTEALVAIDVNTGKFVGKSDKLEDTITRTNLEAAKEIVRQIRLRDLGGIIVLDLIDMEERKNRQKVMMALQQELSHDRAPSKILSINDFGLVAITRKRVKQSLERTLCTPCPYCQGGGMVKSAQTMCFEILEQAKAMSKQVSSNNDVMLRVSPAVAEAFRTSERAVLEEVDAYFGSPVSIEADPNLHQEQFDFAVV